MREESTLGAWLRQRRKDLALTQDGLAERVGCSVETIRKLEAGRAPLHVYGERESLVPPLTLPDRQRLPGVDQLPQYKAVRSTNKRTQAVQPDFVLSTATAPAVVESCWRLDGLPLASELAAARGKLFPPAAPLGQWGGKELRDVT